MERARIILTMKWGTLYSADYVNVLYSACRASLTGHFEFVCFTDDTEGLRPEITAYPLPDGFTPRHYQAGAWPKLGVFAKDVHGLSGRALFIDLDTVLTGALDPLFEVPGEVVCIDQDAWRAKTGTPGTATGIFAFDLGTQSHVLERFQADPKGALETYDNEQDFLHGEHGAVGYWPEGWVISFKYHLRPPLLVDRFRGPRPPEPPAKVLAFHGVPRPIDLIHPPKGNWDRFPHYGRGQVDWMVAYWTRHGGRV